MSEKELINSGLIEVFRDGLLYFEQYRNLLASFLHPLTSLVGRL